MITLTTKATENLTSDVCELIDFIPSNTQVIGRLISI